MPPRWEKLHLAPHLCLLRLPPLHCCAVGRRSVTRSNLTPGGGGICGPALQRKLAFLPGLREPLCVLALRLGPAASSSCPSGGHRQMAAEAGHSWGDEQPGARQWCPLVNPACSSGSVYPFVSMVVSAGHQIEVCHWAVHSEMNSALLPESVFRTRELVHDDHHPAP